MLCSEQCVRNHVTQVLNTVWQATREEKILFTSDKGSTWTWAMVTDFTEYLLTVVSTSLFCFVLFLTKFDTGSC